MLSVSVRGFPVSWFIRMLVFLSLALSPSTHWRAYIYPLKCCETISAPVLTSSPLPALFSQVLQPPPSCLPLVSLIQFTNLCLALRTPKMDVVSESNKYWVGGGWHFPGLCPYIQTVTGCLCSQDSLLAHLTFTAQQDPQGLSQSAVLQDVGCISSREILSQGQDFAHPYWISWASNSSCLLHVIQDGSPALEQIDNWPVSPWYQL